MLNADQPAPYRRNNLKEDVAAYVRELIFSGNLRPGAKVDQDRIAEALGTSKLPVREALILLEGEGLIESQPRRGAYVASLTAEDIYDHYHVFALVVALAAERAAQRITDSEIEALEAILAKMEQWDSSEAATGHEDLNDEFHRIINRVGGSRRLNSVIRLLANGIPDRLYHQTRGWTESAQMEHRELLEAMKSHSGERAAKAARTHIDSGAQTAIAILTERGFWESSTEAPVASPRPTPITLQK